MTSAEIHCPGEEAMSAPASAQPDIFVMPATPCQKRFWALHQMRPDNHALNMPLAWRCRGGVQPEVAAAALSALVRRHESLRTTFEVVDGELSQVIGPAFVVDLPVEDLRKLPEDARRRQAEERVRRAARIQIDIEHGPIFHARLIRMDAEEDILLITIHHSVCDGWSNGVVIRDFAALYDSLMRGVPDNLPELSIQFGDFAVWLDEWRKGGEPAKFLDYWRRTLEGGFVPLRIARDFPGGRSQERGEIETLLLTQELVQRCRDFCAAEGVTLHMLLMSIWAMLLCRLTGQGDIVVGTPCANRRAGTEDLIGPFSNPQVLRVKMKPDDSRGTVLGRVRDWAIGAVAHQDLPFEDMVEDPFFTREANQIPLQVYFIYQKAFMQAQQTPSIEIVPLRSVSPGTMFDLLLSIVERTEGPRLQLEYNPGYFRAATIESILRLFQEILEATLGNPAGTVQDLPALQRSKGEPAEAGPANDGGEIPAADALPVEYVMPRDHLEAQVAAIWEEAMGVSRLSVRASFFDLGGRSLAAMRIVTRANRAFGLDFGLATLFSGNTVEKMAELIRSRLSANTTSAIVPMQPRGSAAPLFIIHGAGGNIVRFFQLANLIGSNHPVYGVQAQSLLSGQPALLRLEDQAAYYLEEIRKVQPKGPYYFLGYSYGGSVALEIAQQLRAAGERVSLLGMLDSREREYMELVRSRDSVRSRLDRRVSQFRGNIGRLSIREKLEYLRMKVVTRSLRTIYRLAFGLGFRTIPAFMKSTDDISWVAAMNYRPHTWAETVTLFRASEQPDPRLPRDLGWSRLIQGGVDVYELPGDHDLVFQEPNIRILASQLRTCLDRVDASAPVASLGH